MAIIPYQDKQPSVASTEVFIAPDAWVIGDVTIAEQVSVFFGAVVRGDINPIKIGKGTNLQEHVIIHTSWGLGPVLIGEESTIGHRVILHGCTIGNRCIIGMGTTVLDGAEIGDECIIGAGSLVTMNCKIPPRTLAFGSPARPVRALTHDELELLHRSATSYKQKGAWYAQYLRDGIKA